MEENLLPKQRHYFVTFWLYFIIFGNLFVILLYLLTPNEIISKYLHQTTNQIFESIIESILTIMLMIIILKWKKWGFWVFAIISVIKAIKSFGDSSHPIIVLIGGLIGVLVLYLILQIRIKNVSSWQNLE